MNASVKLLELVLPSTVALHTRVRREHPSVQVLGNERNGSGFLVEPGLVLTVHYACMGASEIEVSTLDERKLPGRVVAQDFGSGLALIAIEDDQIPPLRLAPGELQVGQEIFIAAASANNTRRVHDGMISGLKPFEAFWEYALDRAVSTTAMNPGFGGGALLDLHGRACALVSLDLNEIGHFTLGIPIEEFTKHRDELMQHGRRVSRVQRAWIGFFCYTVGDHIVIAGVLDGTPGEKAGLRAGDIVLMADDQRIETRRDLYEQLWTHKPGETIRIRVFRDNAMKLITVESGDADRFFA